MRMHFLGCGNSHSSDLGNSSAVFGFGDNELVIDFGFTAFHAYKKRYNRLPGAIFITHCHLDHIGGLENLFFESYFNNEAPIKIYMPADLVPSFHQRMASSRSILAEGGANFYDAFQLIPVGDGFYHKGLYFNVFENRHHALKSSFGIALPGVFFYSGDTKPIPEVINTFASNDETIFHDMSLSHQPSHSYLDEILVAYKQDILTRCLFYHLSKNEDREALSKMGMRFVETERYYEFGTSYFPRKGVLAKG